MSKYLIVIKNTLQLYFVYRLNFLLWRLRVVLSILVTFFLWKTVFQSQHQIFNYQEKDMLTYIILITFLGGTVLSTQTYRIADEINRGVLSNFLLRPISYFRYIFCRDVADKIVNTVCSIGEIILLIILLRPPFFLQSQPFYLLLFIFTILLSSILYLEIGAILSFIAFWSRETWAPRFIFYILISFLAGTYFPLDILPPKIFQILQLLPFTYLIFFPLKIYLGKVDIFFIIYGIAITCIWIALFYLVAKALWRKGLRVYTAEGQ